mgnify:CR=1 FL=1
MATDTSEVLGQAGFRVKSWLFNGENAPRVDPNVKKISLFPKFCMITYSEKLMKQSLILEIVSNLKASNSLSNQCYHYLKGGIETIP